jgi:DNA-binding SARP family transcriptional activator
MIELRLLGPVEASVPLPGGKPKALLARLALDAGRAVSTGVLVADLWESPPPSAAKILQAHISALRKALGAEAIETRAPGYALLAVSSDLQRFERLTERAESEGEPSRRSEFLKDALGLWRGEPLAEFAREPFALAAARRLADLRLDALERRIAAELELGRHEQLVRELTALVRDEPLRERLRGHLMLALYRSGRQVDALAVYREGRRVLVDELGVEPSRTLQELERAILRQDPSLDGEVRRAGRGCVLCAGTASLPLVAPLGRELLVVELVSDVASLPAATHRLREVASAVRTACFTTRDPSADLVRLTREQEAELLVVDEVTPLLLADAPCDVALLSGPPFESRGTVVVPFGGGREEWPALELAGWLARAHELPLRLVGVEARGSDASRTLAAASLALQRFAGVAAEPVIVAPGVEGLLGAAADAAAVVASLPSAELDATRRELRERSPVPVLLVHGGLRPGGLAPDRSLTRFTWSVSPR